MHIKEFQEMMKRLYFQRDFQRGIMDTYNWLVSEIEELGDALNSDNKKNIEEEFADVIAWLASLANISDVDLETALLTKYDNKCPKCQRSPCECKS